MPAPDLGPPLIFPSLDRPLAVHLLPALVAPESLAGSVVIMIDALRASVTIAAALHSGAVAVIPTLTVEETFAKREQLCAQGIDKSSILLGGERGGVLIPGFDLDNSPLAYTPDRVARRTLIFTTANGTATLLHARAASRILVGSLTNVDAVCSTVASDPRPVHIICSGTRGEVTLDDCLAAGAIAEGLVRSGRQTVSDNSALLCIRAWKEARSAGLLSAMQSSRGGRNLAKLGLARDVEYCSTLNALPFVPEFNVASGRINATTT